MGIYAASKLTCEQQEHIAVLKEEGMFCCGGTLIPKDHVLYGNCFAQPNATCAAPVVAHLYFARAKYPPVLLQLWNRRCLASLQRAEATILVPTSGQTM